MALISFSEHSLYLKDLVMRLYSSYGVAREAKVVMALDKPDGE